MSSPNVTIGPFVVGEKPDPIEYQFLDVDGAAMDLTAYLATFTVRERCADQPSVDNVPADVTTATEGRVTYSWTGTEFPTPGHYTAEIWVGNNAQRYASVLIEFDVRAPVYAVPAI